MQNVGTPRFYIDSGLYQYTIGAWTPEADQVSLVQLNPTNSVSKPANNIVVPRISPIKYIAFLGHNGGSFSPAFNPSASRDDFEEIINMSGTDGDELYTGFSIATFTDMEDATGLEGVIESSNSTIGAVSIGDYYDIQSPDLSLKLTYEYDGVKNIQTKGGATLSNASYYKPANWGNMGAWQLGTANTPNPSNLRSGRRVWDLSFSYLSDESLMPNLGVQNYEDDGTGGIVTTEDILSGTDFFSVVWNRTMGGHLPFIFNPNGADGTGQNNSPDQFAICRFVGKSLQYNQIAPNTYNVKLKIRETW
tara:strand:- start:228 stop:1145 length:918 start_codon:yes stop_codon:yes gene_type:complete